MKKFKAKNLNSYLSMLENNNSQFFDVFTSVTKDMDQDQIKQDLRKALQKALKKKNNH